MRDRLVISAGLVAFLAIAATPVWYNIATHASPQAPALAMPSRTAIERVRARSESPSVRPSTGSGRREPVERRKSEGLTVGPSDRRTLGPSCIAPRDYMRASHMQMLVSWRDDVVRRGDRAFVDYDGRRYEKNLTATCLGCHEDKAKFCDRCHDYAGVAPQCPVCHQTPRGGGNGSR